MRFRFRAELLKRNTTAQMQRLFTVWLLRPHDPTFDLTTLLLTTLLLTVYSRCSVGTSQADVWERIGRRWQVEDDAVSKVYVRFHEGLHSGGCYSPTSSYLDQSFRHEWRAAQDEAGGQALSQDQTAEPQPTGREILLRLFADAARDQSDLEALLRLLSIAGLTPREQTTFVHLVVHGLPKGGLARLFDCSASKATQLHYHVLEKFFLDLLDRAPRSQSRERQSAGTDEATDFGLTPEEIKVAAADAAAPPTQAGAVAPLAGRLEMEEEDVRETLRSARGKLRQFVRRDRPRPKPGKASADPARLAELLDEFLDSPADEHDPASKAELDFRKYRSYLVWCLVDESACRTFAMVDCPADDRPAWNQALESALGQYRGQIQELKKQLERQLGPHSVPTWAALSRSLAELLDGVLDRLDLPQAMPTAVRDSFARRLRSLERLFHANQAADWKLVAGHLRQAVLAEPDRLALRLRLGDQALQDFLRSVFAGDPHKTALLDAIPNTPHVSVKALARGTGLGEPRVAALLPELFLPLTCLLFVYRNLNRAYRRRFFTAAREPARSIV